ncbi:MAG TPA: tRNA dimethylallyltransferase [Thermoanaerobaculia bacterium]|nr:tRNA dimethylallyltransferase [Thermoanaerobaculia bacterium]
MDGGRAPLAQADARRPRPALRGAGSAGGYGAAVARSRDHPVDGAPRERPRPASRGDAGRRILKLALLFPRQDIYTRVQRRVRAMWNAGWPREVEELLAGGVPPDAPAFRAIGYGELVRRAAGELSDEEAFDRTVARTRALARRQATWLASEPALEVLGFEEARRRAGAFLAGGGA